ncbi:hypothetical protein FKW77_005950 [Venturia effusa]|uniref:Uncharacterized protein n=1 Tax=Venturia effusa TaxID=50376 RepID=A0A517LKB3_9PEZI|nr:hypothetical protein FKW77_005950 [Venturia effusa]
MPSRVEGPHFPLIKVGDEIAFDSDKDSPTQSIVTIEWHWITDRKTEFVAWDANNISNLIVTRGPSAVTTDHLACKVFWPPKSYEKALADGTVKPVEGGTMITMKVEPDWYFVSDGNSTLVGLVHPSADGNMFQGRFLRQKKEDFDAMASKNATWKKFLEKPLKEVKIGDMSDDPF